MTNGSMASVIELSSRKQLKLKLRQASKERAQRLEFFKLVDFKVQLILHTIYLPAQNNFTKKNCIMNSK